MRYDGPRDGIEYVTLATVGGGQSSLVPEAGYLHQFHHVTVRPDGIALACIPVGETMDVRDITGTVSDETGRLARQNHPITSDLSVGEDGSGGGTVTVVTTNPTGRPVEFTLVPGSEDSRWRFSPDHQHVVVEAGETHRLTFEMDRDRDSLDAGWRPPTISLDADYLGATHRYPLPTRMLEAPVATTLSAPERPEAELGMRFDGEGQAVRIEPDAYDLPDGPFTLEAWFNGDSFGDRVGLVNRTEGSEFGFFLSKGKPSFYVHLDGRYAFAESAKPILQPKTWHHLAGVYDGSELRLYLDGALVARDNAGKTRTRNTLPLLIGADVDGNGRPTSPFDGRIDEVRLSSIARYEGENATPERRHESDASTVLLFHFDALQGPWLFDDSSNQAHGSVQGTPRLVPLDRQ